MTSTGVNIEEWEKGKEWKSFKESMVNYTGRDYVGNFEDCFIDIINTLLAQQRRELKERVEKVKIPHHLPEGMNPNIDEEIWNNAINKVLELLDTPEGKETI